MSFPFCFFGRCIYMTDEQYFHRWHRHLPPKAMARERERLRLAEKARIAALPFRERMDLKRKARAVAREAKREAKSKARLALHQKREEESRFAGVVGYTPYTSRGLSNVRFRSVGSPNGVRR
jgi:hypothetical protein